MPKTPSPCIDVCKFKRAGHCIGCSMTKDQKSMFKALKTEKHRQAFVEMLVGQQSRLGKYRHWSLKYLRKCLKKKVKPVQTVRDLASNT
ncbi:DUF1289 domain-containing protein [Cognatishimia sp. F0-27]|uniref:DUF1289 domain-containing protein n=1 Tax=Cognatishimia sp. F0-27 TaxID=2816855 RepID=UPI001D0C68D3|nr:DUF1289 domain-containing protein [Cognatishimia sp. F0-27]MCC1493099.1 DUF1289 domain-containing protein [Cognatishimia sp. F0-27]